MQANMEVSSSRRVSEDMSIASVAIHWFTHNRCEGVDLPPTVRRHYLRVELIGDLALVIHN